MGGGFGGLNTALTLDSLLNESIDDDDDDWNNDGKPEIILIDPKERFVFLPLLYELCRGEAEVRIKKIERAFNYYFSFLICYYSVSLYSVFLWILFWK